MSVKSEILNQFTQVAEEQNRCLAPLGDDLPLLNSGLDSLCLAVIVARLEDTLGIDPLGASEDSFPVTVGEFVRFYENALRKHPVSRSSQFEGFAGG
jgi:acyl carrier protein